MTQVSPAPPLPTLPPESLSMQEPAYPPLPLPSLLEIAALPPPLTHDLYPPDNIDIDARPTRRPVVHSGWRLWLLISAVWWAFFVVHFDGTVAALRGYILDFRPVAPAQSVWPATYPAIAGVVAFPFWTPIASALGDRSAMMAAVVLFLLGTILTSAAPSLLALCAFRAVQTVGGAGVSALAVIACTYRVPNSIRAVALNGLGAAMALATILSHIVAAQ
ncbi:hypothetical protein HK405_014963, partial [Cladochytrium tenue]